MEVTETDTTVVLELSVAKDDVGKVIGKQGRIARAVRTIVKASAVRDGKRAIVEIVIDALEATSDVAGRRDHAAPQPRTGGPPVSRRGLWACGTLGKVHGLRGELYLNLAADGLRPPAARRGVLRRPRPERRGGAERLVPAACGAPGAPTSARSCGSTSPAPARRPARCRAASCWPPAAELDAEPHYVVGDLLGLRVETASGAPAGAGRRRLRDARSRDAPGARTGWRRGAGTARRRARRARRRRRERAPRRRRPARRPRLPKSDEDAGSTGGAGRVRFDVFTLFPQAFEWYLSQVHIRNAAGARPRVPPHQLPRPHAAEAPAGRRHARTAAAPAWCCASTSSAPPWRRCSAGRRSRSGTAAASSSSRPRGGSSTTRWRPSSPVRTWCCCAAATRASTSA